MSTPKNKEPAPFSLGTVYLIFYNILQTLGWSFIFYVYLRHMTSDKTRNTLFNQTKTLLYIFQTAAILEIVHAAVGLVRSNPVLTGFQVFSRVFVVWGVVYSVPAVQTGQGVPLWHFAWCVTEIIRYSYYAFALTGDTPATLTWLRYTLFIVLYPIGVTGELLTIYDALPSVKETGLYSIPMPNPANIAFSYYYFLIYIMVSYIPIFPQLYFHMFAQRKKVLAPSPKKTD